MVTNKFFFIYIYIPGASPSVQGRFRPPGHSTAPQLVAVQWYYILLKQIQTNGPIANIIEVYTILTQVISIYMEHTTKLVCTVGPNITPPETNVETTDLAKEVPLCHPIPQSTPRELWHHYDPSQGCYAC